MLTVTGLSKYNKFMATGRCFRVLAQSGRTAITELLAFRGLIFWQGAEIHQGPYFYWY